MTIDERLQALTQSVELLTLDVHALQEQQKLLDARERKARTALLSGIAAYLQALGTENADET
jgi:hypothetical protein